MELSVEKKMFIIRVLRDSMSGLISPAVLAAIHRLCCC